MKIATLTIVGVGLIGGSVGMAARRRGVADRVIGVGRRAEALKRALAAEAIDDAAEDLRAGVAEAELVIFCTPVDAIVAGTIEAAHSCQPDTILTDAGSTKAEIVAALEERLPRPGRFVGGHPLAGSEKPGVENADANLFEGRVVVLTPTPRTDAGALQRLSGFWEALGADVRVMEAGAHDRAVAWTSHLPHLVAAAVARMLPTDLQELTASGFRDTTRIAGGDSQLWAGILLQNREAVLAALQAFRGGLERWQAALHSGDRATVEELLSEAKRVRDALGN